MIWTHRERLRRFLLLYRTSLKVYWLCKSVIFTQPQLSILLRVCEANVNGHFSDHGEIQTGGNSIPKSSQFSNIYIYICIYFFCSEKCIKNIDPVLQSNMQTHPSIQPPSKSTQNVYLKMYNILKRMQKNIYFYFFV